METSVGSRWVLTAKPFVPQYYVTPSLRDSTEEPYYGSSYPQYDIAGVLLEQAEKLYALADALKGGEYNEEPVYYNEPEEEPSILDDDEYLRNHLNEYMAAYLDINAPNHAEAVSVMKYILHYKEYLLTTEKWLAVAQCTKI